MYIQISILSNFFLCYYSIINSITYKNINPIYHPIVNHVFLIKCFVNCKIKGNVGICFLLLEFVLIFSLKSFYFFLFRFRSLFYILRASDNYIDFSIYYHFLWFLEILFEIYKNFT